MGAAKIRDAFGYSIEDLLDWEALPNDPCWLSAVDW